MRITSIDLEGHAIIEELDAYENARRIKYYGNDLFAHLNDFANPHHVMADQVLVNPVPPWEGGIPGSVTVQSHISEDHIHVLWAGIKKFACLGSNLVLMPLTTNKYINISTPTVTRNEMVFVDGILRLEGVADDYGITRVPGDPSIPTLGLLTVTFLDADTYIHPDSIIQVLYEERKY